MPKGRWKLGRRALLEDLSWLDDAIRSGMHTRHLPDLCVGGIAAKEDNWNQCSCSCWKCWTTHHNIEFLGSDRPMRLVK